MKVNLIVTIGVEVNTEEARETAKKILGCEYTEDLCDEECCDIWADSKFNQGFGCEVEMRK